jgi:hypothetical protein
MRDLNMYKNLLKLTVLFIISFNASALNTNPSLCTGPSSLLAIIDRPTAAFSACVIPEKNILIENGFQYVHLLNQGIQQNLPNTEIRIGLGNQFEFELFVPNYIVQTVSPTVGVSATAMSMKHILGSDEHSVITLFGALVTPSGSASFGSQGVGGSLTGILSHNFTEALNLTGMLGVSTQTLAINNGGLRFYSINPDLVFSWNRNKTSIYGEVYGQSRTGPYQGSGFNADVGVIYLVVNNVAVDVEIGKRLSGALGNFNNYFGVGVSIQFS